MIKKRAGRKKGTKNRPQTGGGYSTGYPATNLLLAVLAHAKRDAVKEIPQGVLSEYLRQQKAFILSAREMWQAFTVTDFYGKRSIDPLETAWWVITYIKEVQNA